MHTKLKKKKCIYQNPREISQKKTRQNFKIVYHSLWRLWQISAGTHKTHHVLCWLDFGRSKGRVSCRWRCLMADCQVAGVWVGCCAKYSKFSIHSRFRLQNLSRLHFAPHLGRRKGWGNCGQVPDDQWADDWGAALTTFNLASTPRSGFKNGPGRTLGF